jgi:hypothetical protein
MKKKLLTIFLSVFLLIFVLVSLVIIWAVYGPSLDQEQMISVSTAPLTKENADPYFKQCDSIDCSCSCTDPFDPRIKAGKGAFEGKCLNSCFVRTALEIPDTMALKYGYSGKILQRGGGQKYVVNISHLTDTQNEEFYVAAVNPDGIRDVILMVEYAGGVQGHAELRFVFDPSNPVILVPQNTDSERAVDTTTDLIYSVEAIAPPGVPYKGDYGFREEFFQRYRICTLESKAYTTIKILKRRVWQYPIRVSTEVKKRMFLAAINFATKADPTERYHTSKRNCTIRAFDVINAGSGISWYRKPLLFFTNSTLFLPTRAFNHLKYRGLVPGSKEDYASKNLEVELRWEEYIDTTKH